MSKRAPNPRSGAAHRDSLKTKEDKKNTPRVCRRRNKDGIGKGGESGFKGRKEDDDEKIKKKRTPVRIRNKNGG
ncbi:hypothetical protein TNCV_3114911 [Trichonephila clavipes]|nr:hypothetical protein TNCV_3114911 [Trichonephila clavipes]